MEEKQHKRRVHYSGKYPKKFEEKYKEHNPERYGDTVARVIEKGSTPAGMHISIMVQEILDFLEIQPLSNNRFMLAKGIAQVSLASDVPVMFGVVTTDTIEQAIERAGTKAGNKGSDCAMAALEMAGLMEEFDDIEDEAGGYLDFDDDQELAEEKDDNPIKIVEE